LTKHLFRTPPEGAVTQQWVTAPTPKLWSGAPAADPQQWRRLKTVIQESGPVFSKPMARRGLAPGDFNNDGGLDVLITVNDDAPLLLRNDARGQNHWLGLRLIGRKASIDAVGARVAYQAGDLKRGRLKVAGGSYLSSHDPRMVLGIGPRTKIDWLEIKWPQPSGLVERFSDLPIDRYITITEGEGRKEQ